MQWHTFWRHDELFSVMVCSLLQCDFLLSWRISWPAYIVLTFFSSFREKHILKTYFWCHWDHDIFLTSWQNVFLTSCPAIVSSWHHFGNKILWKRVFDVIDMIIYLCYFMVTFDVMTNPLSSCHVFDNICWRHGVFLTSLQICRCYDMFMTSWHTFLTYISDVMINLLTSRRVLMSSTCFDVFVTSWLTFWSMLHLLTSWRTFRCHGRFWRYDTLFMSWRTIDMFFSWWRIFFIISGTKYNVNVISVLWRHFWCHDVFLTSWQTVWRRGVFFYFGTNFLHHYVYLTLRFFGLVTNPLTRFLSSWVFIILGTNYN